MKLPTTRFSTASCSYTAEDQRNPRSRFSPLFVIKIPTL